MNDFPTGRDEWYARRDDRTRRVDGSRGFEDLSLGVIVDPRIESDFSLQVMALTSANILARWCRTVRIQLPSATSCLPIGSDLDLRYVLEETMSRADPYGQFTFGEVAEDEVSQVLVVGEVEESLLNPYVWINGCGWIAGFGYGTPSSSPPQERESNPVGPAFASCVGMAEIFRQAIGNPRPTPYSIWYSLYDFSKTTDDPAHLTNPGYDPQFDFGRIHQVGCGAVGSSLDFFLSLTRWKGTIHLIDFDDVDITNCNRSLALTAYDFANGKRKTKACADALRHSGMSPTIFDGSYSDFISGGGFLDCPPDMILCLANERNVWADIQHNYPPLVFHATTTSSWGLNFGRHVAMKEWCILCRFSKDIDHRFVSRCSEGEIGIADEGDGQIFGVLPFLSPGSAVLVLAEMAKMANDDYPVNKDFIEFSMRTPEGEFLQAQKEPNSGCECRCQSSDLYRDEVKKTRFWRLTQGLETSSNQDA